jgi:hypothetical protein
MSQLNQLSCRATLNCIQFRISFMLFSEVHKKIVFLILPSVKDHHKTSEKRKGSKPIHVFKLRFLVVSPIGCLAYRTVQGAGH